MTDPDISLSLARKQFARSLWILVIIQVVGICMAIPCFLLSGLFVADALVVPAVVGVCLWIGGAAGGCYVLCYSKIMPRRVQLYGKVGNTLLLVCCIIVPLSLLGFCIPFFVVMFFAYVWFLLLFLGCGFIPQFFIARWLANEAKDGTMDSK